MRQTHFTGNLDGDGITQFFFIIEEAKRNSFSKETNKVL